MVSGGGGFNPAVPKLPPISGCMTNQSAFMPYDPAGKDGGFLPSQPKNLGGMNNGGLYGYQPLPGPPHMLTSQLMQEVGMSQTELLNNFSKIKPYDMQYPTGMSGLMGQSMNMYNSKMHPKDSFDN